MAYYGWDSALLEALGDIDYAYDRVCLRGSEFERGTATEQEWIDAAFEFLDVVDEAVHVHGDQALGEVPAWAAFIATEWVSKGYLDIGDVWGTVYEMVHATCAVQHIAPAAIRLIVSHMIRAGQEGFRFSESHPATRIVAWHQHEMDFLQRTADFQAELYDVVQDIEHGVSPLRPVAEEAPAPAPAQPQPEFIVRLKALLDAVEETRPTSDDRIRAYAAVFEEFIRVQHLFERTASFSRLLVMTLTKLVIETKRHTQRFEDLDGVRSIDAMSTDLLLGIFGLAPRPFRPQVLSRVRQLQALQAVADPHYRELANGFYDELCALYDHMMITDACNYERPETLIEQIGINDTFEIDHPDNFIELRSGRVRRHEPMLIVRPAATDDVCWHHGLSFTQTHETHDVVVIVDAGPQTPPGSPPAEAEFEFVSWREDPDCAHEFMFAERDEDSDDDEYDDCYDCFDSEGEWDRAEFERRRNLLLEEGGWEPLEIEIEEQRRHEAALSLRDH